MCEYDVELLIFFLDEIVYLIEINNKLDNVFKKVENFVDKFDKDYMDVKMYMVKNCGEIDLYEMF